LLLKKYNKINKIVCFCALAAGMGGVHAAATPETVFFPSRDGKTQLTAFLYKPAMPGPHPAVVMMHGRSGPYSSLKRGVYDAENLTLRHKMWGDFWAQRGYLSLHVDSFGPRGYPQGFPRHSYNRRPPEVSEQQVRPLDAYGALDYLRLRGDVMADRIGLQGWSNGAMALLAAMGGVSAMKQAAVAGGFRAALALYPSCRAQLGQADYVPQAPVLLMVASDDEEVSPQICVQLAAAVEARGGRMQLVYYEGAHHAYDDPGPRKQSHAPNRAALEDTQRRAAQFFHEHLQP
jgi:dienelactone hydrolase